MALAQETRFEFNIPAQPLAAALETYGKVSQRDVLFNSNLKIGRRSTGVQGYLSADTALMIMLEGTGLSARYQTSGSFVLLPAPDAPEAGLPLAVGRYYGKLQATLRTTLCSDGKARPGSYRVAIRLWVGSTGDVIRYERLSSTGTSGLDEGVDQSLRNLRIGASPPIGLEQPITIVIVPQARGLTMGCDTVPMRDIEAAP